jgi:hypothetical protein
MLQRQLCSQQCASHLCLRAIYEDRGAGGCTKANPADAQQQQQVEQQHHWKPYMQPLN